MAPTTVTGLAALALAVPLAAAAAGAWRTAAARPDFAEAPHRVVPGRVVALLTAECGPRNSRRTCYRPLVEYADGGRTAQVATRGGINPAPVRVGETADVLVFADGSAWVGLEWRRRQADRRREEAAGRRTPTVVGWLFAGCAGASALLGLGLLFWVDRSGTDPR